MYLFNTTIKFTDNTTLVGLITTNDDIAYRAEVQCLTEWCDYGHGLP